MAEANSFVCEVCGNIFDCPFKLQEHRHKVERKPEWQCYYCSFETITNSFLLNHINENHSSDAEIKHRCDYCDPVNATTKEDNLDEVPWPSITQCYQALTAPGAKGVSQVISTTSKSGVTERWHIRFANKRRPNLPDNVIIKRLRESP